VAALGAGQPEPGQPLRALAELRRLLSSRARPPVQEVVDLGGVEILVARLRDSSPAAQLEAAWALASVAGGGSAHAAAVLKAGAAEAAFGVLARPEVSERPDLCDQCLSLLGNLAGDRDLRLRDRLLEAEVIGHLGQLYQQIPGFPWDLHGRLQVLRSLTWLMSSLCHGLPAPPLEEVDCAFDYFAQVIMGTDDEPMLAEALWGLCYLLEGAKNEEEAGARALRLLSAGFGPEEPSELPVPHPVLAKAMSCARRTTDPESPVSKPALRLLTALASSPSKAAAAAAAAVGGQPALRELLGEERSPAKVAQLSVVNASATAASLCVDRENVPPAAQTPGKERKAVQPPGPRGGAAVAEADRENVPPAARTPGRERKAAHGGGANGADAGRENVPPAARTPSKDCEARTPGKEQEARTPGKEREAPAPPPSAISRGSPLRPAAYKFGG